jgi:hypothetical protein
MGPLAPIALAMRRRRALEAGGAARSQVDCVNSTHRERVETLHKELRPAVLIRASLPECVVLRVVSHPLAPIRHLRHRAGRHQSRQHIN